MMPDFQTQLQELSLFASSPNSYLSYSPQTQLIHCLPKKTGLMGWLSPSKTSDETVQKVAHFLHTHQQLFRQTPLHRTTLYQIERAFPQTCSPPVRQILQRLEWGGTYETPSAFQERQNLQFFLSSGEQALQLWSHSQLTLPLTPTFHQAVRQVGGSIELVPEKEIFQVSLPNVSPLALRSALNMLYAREPSLPQDLEELALLTEESPVLSLLLTDFTLTDRCEKALLASLTPQSFFSFLKHPKSWETPLGKVLIQYAATHFEGLMKHPLSPSLSPSLLEKVLQHPDLLGPEPHIFHLLLHWAERYCQVNLIEDLPSFLLTPLGEAPSLLSHIRFEHYDLDHFVQDTSHYNLLAHPLMEPWIGFLSHPEQELPSTPSRPKRKEFSFSPSAEKGSFLLRWNISAIHEALNRDPSEPFGTQSPAFDLAGQSWRLVLERFEDGSLNICLARYSSESSSFPQKKRLLKWLYRFPASEEIASGSHRLKTSSTWAGVHTEKDHIWKQRLHSTGDHLPLVCKLHLSDLS